MNPLLLERLCGYQTAEVAGWRQDDHWGGQLSSTPSCPPTQFQWASKLAAVYYYVRSGESGRPRPPAAFWTLWLIGSPSVLHASVFSKLVLVSRMTSEVVLSVWATPPSNPPAVHPEKSWGWLGWGAPAEEAAACCSVGAGKECSCPLGHSCPQASHLSPCLWTSD
jgi:hypothetical protein